MRISCIRLVPCSALDRRSNGRAPPRCTGPERLRGSPGPVPPSRQRSEGLSWARRRQFWARARGARHCAIQLARGGNAVRLWGRSPQAIGGLQRTGSMRALSAGITLPAAIQLTASLEAPRATGDLLSAVPSHAFTGDCRRARAGRPPHRLGHQGSGGRDRAALHEVAAEHLGRRCAIGRAVRPDLRARGRSRPSDRRHRRRRTTRNMPRGSPRCSMAAPSGSTPPPISPGSGLAAR